MGLKVNFLCRSKRISLAEVTIKTSVALSFNLELSCNLFTTEQEFREAMSDINFFTDIQYADIDQTLNF